MEELKLANHNTTLVDSVEESLISYFKEQGLRPGCSIPNEMELAASLGVGRAVLREALSRFKMTGMIVSRTKKGMVLGEPSLLGGMKRCINPLLMNESTLCDILEFRVALEIGISDNIFRNLTDADVAELKEIVEMSQVIGNNKYAPVSEHRFHTKLYEITGNKIITEFQDIIYPVLDFVKEKYRDFLEPIEKELERAGALVTHRDLLKYIENRDLKGYKKAIEEHFRLYSIYLERHKKWRRRSCGRRGGACDVSVPAMPSPAVTPCDASAPAVRHRAARSAPMNPGQRHHRFSVCNHNSRACARSEGRSLSISRR